MHYIKVYQTVPAAVQNSLHPTVDELTPASFEKRVVGRAEGETWVVDYFAPWCGPCQQVGREK